MAVILLALLVMVAGGTLPVWPYSRGWSWWPPVLTLLVLAILVGLLIIERIEAA